MRVILVLLIVSGLSACSRQPTSSKITSDETVTTEAVNRLSCESQIAAWTVELNDFRSQQNTKEKLCSDINNHQIELNTRYRDTASEWPMSISYLRDCFAKHPEDTGLCWGGVDVLNIPFPTKAADLSKLLSSYNEEQKVIISDARSNSCKLLNLSSLNTALGIPQSHEDFVSPEPPAKPACASTPSRIKISMPDRKLGGFALSQL
jgi:hypothetical protein